MPAPSPERRILVATQIGALLVLLLFAADLFITQQRELDTGRTRVQRFNTMLGEHTARSFEAVDFLLREIASHLSLPQAGSGKNVSLDWRQWSDTEGWDYLAERQSATLPQLRLLRLFNAQGKELFASRPASTLPQITPSPLVAALKDIATPLRFGPFVDPRDGQITYALGQRIQNHQGVTTGYVVATVEPLYLQDFCWPNRLLDEFEAVLINTQDQIVATCRPSDLRARGHLLGHSSQATLYDGALRGQQISEGNNLLGNYVVTRRSIAGFPELAMLTTAPTERLLADWHQRVLELGLMALLIAAIILLGGVLLRRQVSQVRNMTLALEDSHQQLAARVQSATEQLSRQRDTAELSNMAKSRFLAAASHDLRQPMHALSMFVSDLQAQVRRGQHEELPRLAEHIATSTQLLGDLLDALLDISRLDVAGVTPEIRRFPLQPIFDRLAATHRPSALNRRQLLRIRRTSLWLHSDPAMIERMLGNLIGNALRYSPKHGRIHVAARRRGDKVSLEIRDNGIGIAPENQSAVFAEFYQVGNAARESHQGLGLGLSIVDRLAKALDIPITLRSALNQGTFFALTVQGSPNAQEASDSGPRPPKLRTLCCCGDNPVLIQVTTLAAQWGHPILQQTDVNAHWPEIPPYDVIFVCPQETLSDLHRRWPGQTDCIVLIDPETAPATLPDDVSTLKLPLRPAKLRALLGQLQKGPHQNTSSKSMP